MTAPGPWDWAQGYLAPTIGMGPGPSYATPRGPLPPGGYPGLGAALAYGQQMASPWPDLSRLSMGVPSGPQIRPWTGDDWRRLAEGAIWGINSMNPVSDINDAVTGSERFSQGLLGRDWWDAAGGIVDMAGGLLGMALPGHYSQYKEATETAADAARRAVSDAPVPASAPAISARDIIDTRGRGERFHGTSSPIDALGDYYGNDASIYGTGFYTTDAADIGVGYMSKGGGGQPSLYRVHAADDVPLYDLDAPMTPEVREMVRGALGRDFAWAGPTLDDARTLRAFLDEARTGSAVEGVSRLQTQDFFDSIRSNLEDAGYRGYRHRGGANTGTAPHDVRLYWTPARDLKIEMTSPDLYRRPQDDWFADALRASERYAPRGLLGDATTRDGGGLLGYDAGPATGAGYGTEAAEAALSGPGAVAPGRGGVVGGEPPSPEGAGVAAAVGGSPLLASRARWNGRPPESQPGLDRSVAPPGTLFDPEGRPITAPVVVGVRQPGGPDVPVSMAEIYSLLNPLSIRSLDIVPRAQMTGRNNLGEFDPVTREIRVRSGQTPHGELATSIHEALSHGTEFALPGVDVLAGWPRREVTAASRELDPEAWAMSRRYASDPEEMRAHAITGYAFDPEQFKRLYPRVAAAIRQQFNENPILSKAIQFNSLAGLGIGLPLSVLLGLEALGGTGEQGGGA